jgi:N-hydroxyarylamine O-acetyltransferase
MSQQYTIDVESYLERINYRDEINNSVEVLTNLQHAHLFNVPFENLDIDLGRKIELFNSYDKIVNHRRGGFCYELNGTFFQLLKVMGFDVKLISARVRNKNEEFGPEYDHMAIIATIQDAKYLVDVGFGDFTYSPLRIEMSLLQSDRAGTFMIKQHDNEYLVVGKLHEGNFMPAYIFTETSRQMNDYIDMCNFHQTSSESHFTQKRVCSILTDRGRITISGNTLKKTEDGVITETELVSEEEFNKALWDYFKIRIVSRQT